MMVTRQAQTNTANLNQLPAGSNHAMTITETPEWSPQTLAFLAKLTPLERRFTEWYAAGYSGAEAYRRATNRRRSQDDAARQQAFKIRTRPRVAAAIQAALNDQPVGARCDREWLLAKLRAIVEEAADSRSPSASSTALTAITLMARIQGNLGSRSVAKHAHPPANAAVDIGRWIDQQIAEIRGSTSAPEITVPRRKSCDTGDDTRQQEARRPADFQMNECIDKGEPTNRASKVAAELEPWLLEPDYEGDALYGRGWRFG